MINYIIRRILLIFPTLIGITAVVFFTMALSPGGVGGPMLEADSSVKAEVRQALRDYYNKRYGLNQPLIVQYGRWLNKVSPIGFATNEDGTVHLGLPTFKVPDLGESWVRHRSVMSLYADALPITLLLNIVTLPLIYVTAIGSGILAARHRGLWFDKSSSFFFISLYSVPEMMTGVLLIGYLASNQFINWFPASGLHDTQADNFAFLPSISATGMQRGYLLDMGWHLILPAFCLTYASFAVTSKLTRASVLDHLSEDFVRTARAKGVSEKDILFKHVFRNSVLPLITVAAGIIPGLLGGSIIIENIFSIPGMGRLAIEAVNVRDREVILAGSLIGALLVLTFDVIRDICYAIADPRVSYDE